MKFSKKHVAVILILIVFELFLSCKSRTVRPKPESEGWEKCFVCKGFGEIEIYEMETPAIEERNKDDDELYGCCLLMFFSGTEKGEKYEDNIQEQHERGADQSPYFKNKPLEKTMVKCNYCNGTGWLKKGSE